jgi:Uma2 family endonuclease
MSAGLGVVTMVVQSRPTTVEEFERIAALPENADKRFEFIAGEIIEVVSNNYASMIAYAIGAEIRVYTKNNSLGWVTGADGGYWVSGERYMPDVGFISKVRQPQPSHDTWNPNAPDLAVEVVSPTDLKKHITDKVGNYIAAGTVVWLIYPEDKEARIFVPGKPVQIIKLDGILDGGSIFPGFKLSMKDIFKD